MAQIAQYVALSSGVKSAERLGNFIIPFATKKPERIKPKKKRPKRRRELAVKAAVSKAVWTGWAAAMAGKTRCPPKSKNS